MENPQSLRFKVARIFRKIVETLTGAFAALFVFALIVLGVGYLLEAHWTWSLVFIPIFSGLIAIGLWDLGKGRLNLKQAVGTIVLLVAFSVADFAMISFALASKRLASYTGAPVVTFWHLLAYYGWHFLDLLPAVDAVKTLELTPPIRHHGVVAGLPISAFKALFVVVLLKAIKDWWTTAPPQADHDSQKADDRDRESPLT